MIASIKGFFSQFIEPGTTQDGAHSGKALQIATAALLLEMMRMDRHIAEEERASVVATLREQFGLEANQLETLLELAEEGRDHRKGPANQTATAATADTEYNCR